MSETAGSLKPIVNELEAASKQHEVELVVELGPDRLGKWSGIVVLALAGVSKLSDVISDNLTCYPRNATEGFDGEFITYSKSYCWQSISSSNNVSVSGGICSVSPSDEVLVGNEPYIWKLLIQWMFYFMLLQAILFALPGAYWHMRVGARLMGHMKFIQLLLNDIYEQIRSIRKGVHFDKPYDEDSSNFDGLRRYESAAVPEVITSGNTGNADESSAMITENGVSTKAEVKSGCFLDTLLCGKMKDRHLFSMICYENFAQIEQLPYILSVFRVQQTASNSKPPIGGFLPLNKAMLHLWCHESNFNNTFLVKLYMMKHLLTLIFASLMTAAMAYVLPGLLQISGTSGNFPCELVDHDVCVSCTLERKDDFLAFFIVDLVVTSIVIVQSLTTIITMRNFCPDRVTAHFFDDFVKNSHLAFELIEDQNKRDNPGPPPKFLQAMRGKVEEHFAEELVTRGKFKENMEKQLEVFFSSEQEAMKKGDKEMNSVIKKFFKELKNN